MSVQCVFCLVVRDAEDAAGDGMDFVNKRGEGWVCFECLDHLVEDALLIQSLGGDQ